MRISRESTGKGKGKGKIKNVQEFKTAKTNLKTLNKDAYINSLAKMAVNIYNNKNDYKELERKVKELSSSSIALSKLGNKEDFINYYIKEKPDKIAYLSLDKNYKVFNKGKKGKKLTLDETFSIKGFNPKYTEDEAEKLYITFVLDTLITEHNKKLKDIERYEKTFYKSEKRKKFKTNYTKYNVDIEKSVKGQLDIMNFNEFILQFLNEDIINIKAKKDTYYVLKTYDESIRKKMLGFDNEGIIKKRTLRDLGSYTLVFVNNLAYALAKMGWTTAYFKVLEMIRKDMIKEVYEIYKSLNIELIWKYKDTSPIDDGNGSYDDEDKFVKKMEQAIDDKDNK